MEYRGIVRKLDMANRIVLPKSYTDMIGWEVNDHLEVFLKGDTIEIRKIKEENNVNHV